MLCKYKQDLCVQVKNRPCVEYTVIMRLISLIPSCGSKTIMKRQDCIYAILCAGMTKSKYCILLINCLYTGAVYMVDTI
jgi:hypothetical protein